MRKGYCKNYRIRTAKPNKTTKAMKQLRGKNADFIVMWDCYTQTYTVYYKGKFLIGNKYKYSDIQSYLN